MVKRLYCTKLMEEAISCNKEAEPIDWKDVKVEENYTGPKLDSADDITESWLFKIYILLTSLRVVELMEYQKGCKNLHRRYLWMILEKFE